MEHINRLHDLFYKHALFSLKHVIKPNSIFVASQQPTDLHYRCTDDDSSTCTDTYITDDASSTIGMNVALTFPIATWSD